MGKAVSVLLPTWNRAGMLRAAVRSILSQTFPDFELLVYDDGSTDRTRELVTTVAACDPRIRYFRGQSNQGFPLAMNRLLEQVRTPYACLMGSDDISNVHRLAEQVNLIRQHKAAGVVSSFEWFRATPPASWREPPVSNAPAVKVVDLERDYDRFANGSLLFDVAKAKGLRFDPAHSLGGSDALHLGALAAHGPIMWTPQILYYVRRHPGRITAWRRARHRNPAWHDRMRTIAAAGGESLLQAVEVQELLSNRPPTPPQMTVGLPLYRSRNIAWVALESLCRQHAVDFPWELIIAEESQPESIGADNLTPYLERLAAAGCVSVKYIGLADWIPLGAKWRLIAHAAAGASRLLVIQDSDCYSQRFRLAETMALGGSADWIQSRQGVFYDIATGRQILYDYSLTLARAKTALNMAVRTDLARLLPANAEKRLINGWMYRQCEAANFRRLRVGWNESQSWRLGVDTHGCNTISDRDKFFASPSPPFRPSPDDVLSYLPEDIAGRLREARETARSPMVK